MSVKAVAWALEQEIADPVSHLLLVNLANYADADNRCWPGQDLLAKRIRRSKDAVQRHLTKLEKSGHVTRERRADERGYRTTDLYLLNVVASVGVVPLPSDVSQTPKPHGCGVGLSRKKGSPKPQTPPRLSRTMDAAARTVEPPKEPSGVSSPTPPFDWNSAFGADDPDCVLENGWLQLKNGKLAFWLERFDGDAERLDLALLEIRADLQPNSRTALSLQVERRLARMAGDKRDRDRRYERAVKANPKPTKKAEDIARFRALAESLITPEQPQ